MGQVLQGPSANCLKVLTNHGFPVKVHHREQQHKGGRAITREWEAHAGGCETIWDPLNLASRIIRRPCMVRWG